MAKKTGLARVPLRLLIEVLSASAPEDAARFALCGRFFASLGEDGILWKNLFSQRFPASSLTAQSMSDWKRRSGRSWLVSALGVHSALRCCGNYSQVKRDIAAMGRR